MNDGQKPLVPIPSFGVTLSGAFFFSFLFILIVLVVNDGTKIRLFFLLEHNSFKFNGSH